MDTAPPSTPHTWVFDVDGCMIDSLTGTSLRPGAKVLLERLRHRGCTVLWWSAGGQDYAERRAEAVGVRSFVHAFHGKDERSDAGRYRTEHLVTGEQPVVFVDDRPEDLPIGATFVAVSPYLGDNPHDRGLLPVADRAGITALELFA